MLGICWVGLALLAALILGKQEAAVAFGHAKSGAMGGTSKKDALKSSRFYMAVGLIPLSLGIIQSSTSTS